MLAFAWTAMLLMFAGCQQTASTSRNHNSLFDFTQRPRFFGAGATQSGGSQLAGGQSGMGGNASGFGDTGLFPSSGAAGNSGGKGPFASLFAGYKKKSTPTLAGGGNLIETNSPEQYSQFSQMAEQYNSLNQRFQAADSDNQLLNTEVASLRQKLELANQYNQTLKEQLADTSGRIQQTELQRREAIAKADQIQRQYQQAVAAAQSNQFRQPNQNTGIGSANPFGQASTQQSAGNDRFASADSFNGQRRDQFASATIRANNSLMQRLSEIRIPGGEARMDGDVIRIEFPSDRLFASGTYQIAPSQRPVISDIVTTIQRSFPRQIVGVEAHWDNTPLNPPGTTDHQLTATQSLAVFDELVRLGLPERQLFTMAMASNRPRHPAGRAANRRIELVIYPETYDGS